MTPLPLSQTVFTLPPAKLNLFLELIRKREDDFHEIDTVMTAINWCDRLKLRRREEPGIALYVDWIPSKQIVASELKIDAESELGRRLLTIPSDDRNLVHHALIRFTEHFNLPGGFECELSKSIPAGAGMGGASSDAAAALRLAATLWNIPTEHPELVLLASQLGSDVPFFMGLDGDSWVSARAQGRGEKITPFPLSIQVNAVVVFPAESLSTARIYSAATIPKMAMSAERILAAGITGNFAELVSAMTNRLQEPAAKFASQIDEILKSMWRVGLFGCQLTGSGSACFGLAPTESEAEHSSKLLRNELLQGSSHPEEPVRGNGYRIMVVRSTEVPSAIQFET